MKLLLRIVFCSIVMTWSASSFAGTWVYNQNIQYLYAGEVGARYAIKVTGVQPNPDLCGASFDLIIQNSSKLKEMWAMLLSAYMANKPVAIHLSGCGAAPNNLPIVTDVILGSTD